MKLNLELAQAEIDRLRASMVTEVPSVGGVVVVAPVVVADKPVIPETLNMPIGPATEPAIPIICHDQPSLELLMPTPKPSPENKPVATASLEELSPWTDKEMKMFELVEKLATMTASEKKTACTLSETQDVDDEMDMAVFGKHPIHELQDSGDD